MNMYMFTNKFSRLQWYKIWNKFITCFEFKRSHLSKPNKVHESQSWMNYYMINVNITLCWELWITQKLFINLIQWQVWYLRVISSGILLNIYCISLILLYWFTCPGGPSFFHKCGPIYLLGKCKFPLVQIDSNER